MSLPGYSAEAAAMMHTLTSCIPPSPDCECLRAAPCRLQAILQKHQFASVKRRIDYGVRVHQVRRLMMAKSRADSAPLNSRAISRHS